MTEKKGMKKFIYIISLLLVLSGMSLALLYWYNSPPSLMQKELFTIQKGEALSTTAGRLHRHNLIKSPLLFRLLPYVTLRRHVKTGQYQIYAGMSTHDIFLLLTSGKVKTVQVTIPEGYNLYQIAAALEDKGITSSKPFLHYAFNKEFLRQLGITALSAEGYLFPETYRFIVGEDPRRIIRVMYGQLEKELEAIEETSLSATLKTRHRLLTLASLIEEEAQVASEQKYISSVFHNRMKKNMRMDCDPTVRYAVKNFDRPITISQLRSNSPWNTYKVKGLPPTPISSPGRGAIEAALYPAETDFLYFVARRDGSHYFSRSLSEHNRAVQFFLRGKDNGFNDTQKLR